MIKHQLRTARPRQGTGISYRHPETVLKWHTWLPSSTRDDTNHKKPLSVGGSDRESASAEETRRRGRDNPGFSVEVATAARSARSCNWMGDVALAEGVSHKSVVRSECIRVLLWSRRVSLGSDSGVRSRDRSKSARIFQSGGGAGYGTRSVTITILASGEAHSSPHAVTSCKLRTS